MPVDRGQDEDGRAKVQDTEMRKFREDVTTVWGQLESLGHDLMESMSTTHPPYIDEVYIDIAEEW